LKNLDLSDLRRFYPKIELGKHVLIHELKKPCLQAVIHPEYVYVVIKTHSANGIGAELFESARVPCPRLHILEFLRCAAKARDYF
jgi:hypothetical protein